MSSGLNRSPLKKIAKNSSHSMLLRRVRPTPLRVGPNTEVHSLPAAVRSLVRDIPTHEVLGPVGGLDDQRDSDALVAEEMLEAAAQPEVQDDSDSDIIDDSAPPELGPEYSDVPSLLAEVRSLARGIAAHELLQESK